MYFAGSFEAMHVMHQVLLLLTAPDTLPVISCITMRIVMKSVKRVWVCVHRYTVYQ